MRRCLFLAGLSVLLLLTPLAPRPAWSQTDQADSQLASKVQRLVRQLDDNRLARREAAEEKLIELGPKAVEFFPQITPRTPAEVQQRLDRVREALELASARRAAEPSRVTLQGEMPLTDALRQLDQQTGNRISGYKDREGKVSTDFEETPYWQALDALLDQSGLKVVPYGGQENTLVLAARPDGELPPSQGAVYSGIFRFQATRIEARRDLRNPAISGLTVATSVSWEPRVRPISVQLPLGNIEATDDRGNPVAVDQGRGTLSASTESGISAVDLRIPFELPELEARQIASLQGSLRALIPGKTETFEFSDLSDSRDVQKRKAGATVTFEQLRKNLDLYEVRMRVRFDHAAHALESHRNWIFNNQAYVLDADGNRIENAGLQPTRQRPDEAGVAYSFALPEGPEGCTFVYKTPATLLELPVEFELTDIRLP